jgi:hypothetical protein
VEGAADAAVSTVPDVRAVAYSLPTVVGTPGAVAYWLVRLEYGADGAVPYAVEGTAVCSAEGAVPYAVLIPDCAVPYMVGATESGAGNELARDMTTGEYAIFCGLSLPGRAGGVCDAALANVPAPEDPEAGDPETGGSYSAYRGRPGSERADCRDAERRKPDGSARDAADAASGASRRAVRRERTLRVGVVECVRAVGGGGVAGRVGADTAVYAVGTIVDGAVTADGMVEEAAALAYSSAVCAVGAIVDCAVTAVGMVEDGAMLRYVCGSTVSLPEDADNDLSAVNGWRAVWKLWFVEAARD